MKSYLELANRNLINNRKNTLVCIIGIILGTVIMTTTSIIYRAESNTSEEALKKAVGYYDVKFENLSKEQIKNLKNDKRVSNSAVYKKIGISEVKNNFENQYYDVLALGNDAYNNIFTFDIIAGRKPENSSEILIDNFVLETIGKGRRIGDNIDFDVLSGQVSRDDLIFKSKHKGSYDIKSIIEKKEKKSYKIVGIFQSPEEYKNKANTMFTRLTDEEIKSMDKLDVLGTLKFTDMYLEDGISKDLGIKYIPKVVVPDYLQEGAIQSQVKWPDYSSVKNAGGGLGAVGGVIIIFVVCLFVFGVIYNAFNISIVERLKQFGILRAVGATRKQLGKLIFYEAFIIYIIGITVGLVLGVVNTRVLVFGLCKLFELDFSSIKFSISLSYFVIIPLSILFIVMLAANKALFKDTKLSPIQSMNESTLIDDSKIDKVNDIKKINKIFNIEGELSYKNLSRNKKRNKTCLKSIALSMIIIMFFFSQIFLYKIEESSIMPSNNWDIKYSRINRSFSNEDMSNLKKVSGVEDVYVDKTISIGIPIEENKLNKRILESYSSHTTDMGQPERGYKNYYGVKSIFRAVDENTLKVYESNLKEGELNYSKLMNDGIIIVNSGTTEVVANMGQAGINHYFYDVEKILDVKVGDKIKIPIGQSFTIGEDMKKYFNSGHVDTSKFKEFTVIGIVAKDALRNAINTRKPENLTEDITFITSNDVFYKLGINVVGDLDIKTNINGDRTEALKGIKEYASSNYDSNIDLYSKMIDYKNSVNRALCWDVNFEINILVIVILNIVNTFNASIIARKKELASLRAIGMTRKQINKMLLLEGAFLGVLASFLGLILGTLPSYLSQMFMYQKDYGKLTLISLITIIVLIIICILSTIGSLRKLRNLSIVDNIRSE
ncbi:MacB-like core domain-containing protein [Clostridium cavendishii DSM 21758]|uniref:MacB-like core domain-containing protein n=1 Tax=Clostridium cavendishii DSM 21758 TaxID=1121302 RepID=A0A1M6I8H8_9CLOT|nr:FtsX-like permease family protein [Clostridium cavendishii]SHJ30686.1 MacB-like core domain-containing protein [Clostridium cavendishii DSM 21758]